MPIYTYTILDDPLATNGTVATGINGTGQIVGTYNPDASSSHPFLYSAGTYTTLPDDPSATAGTQPTDINDAGQIVGNYGVVLAGHGVADHGFLYSGGTYTTIDDPLAGGASGQGTSANGINRLGQIVGYYVDSGGVQHSFLYNGTYTTLADDPSGQAGTTQAWDINAAGQIVGSYADASNHIHGFLYSGGTYTTLDDPLGPGSPAPRHLASTIRARSSAFMPTPATSSTVFSTAAAYTRRSIRRAVRPRWPAASTMRDRSSDFIWMPKPMAMASLKPPCRTRRRPPARRPT